MQVDHSTIAGQSGCITPPTETRYDTFKLVVTEVAATRPKIKAKLFGMQLIPIVHTHACYARPSWALRVPFPCCSTAAWQREYPLVRPVYLQG